MGRSFDNRITGLCWLPSSFDCIYPDGVTLSQQVQLYRALDSYRYNIPVLLLLSPPCVRASTMKVPAITPEDVRSPSLLLMTQQRLRTQGAAKRGGAENCVLTSLGRQVLGFRAPLPG